MDRHERPANNIKGMLRDTLAKADDATRAAVKARWAEGIGRVRTR